MAPTSASKASAIALAGGLLLPSRFTKQTPITSASSSPSFLALDAHAARVTRCTLYRINTAATQDTARVTYGSGHALPLILHQYCSHTRYCSFYALHLVSHRHSNHTSQRPGHTLHLVSPLHCSHISYH